MLDLAVNQPDAFKQIKDDVVIVYPTPTVWSTHTLMALDEKGDTLLNLLKTPAVQKLAWERHGFRAANFAGTDSISRFGVAGTLDQIPAVSELPNNDAMQPSSPPSNPRKPNSWPTSPCTTRCTRRTPSNTAS